MKGRQERTMGAIKHNVLDIYLRDVDKYDLLDRQKEIEIARKAKEGDTESLTKLVNSNLRFVVRVAKTFQDKGLPLEDLISEGNLGLIEAAKRFEPERGIKFISYAVWWIKCYIRTAILKRARLVRLPANLERLLNKIDRSSERLSEDLGRPPTVEELAQETSSSADKINNVLKAASRHISLEALESAHSNRSTLETIENEDYRETLKKIETRSLRQSIDKSLETLKIREKKVIEMRYGLKDGNPRTLREVGEMMGLSRERVRQIQDEALGQLRDPLERNQKI